MFCNHCGRLLPEGSLTCSLCGSENRRQSHYTGIRTTAAKTHRPSPVKFGWLVAICSTLLSLCLTPIAGIVLYYALRHSEPGYARSVKTGTKIAAILLLVYILLVFLILMITFSLAII